MAKTKNTIELNGKRYDALTGKLLSGSDIATEKVAVKVVHHPKTVTAAKPVKHVDTIVVKTAKAAVAPKGAPITIHTSFKTMDIRRAPAGHLKHHQPEPSKTLMRKVVKKPEPSLKRSLKTQARTDMLARTPTQVLVAKPSLNHIDEIRLKRAEHIAKNTMVSRFGGLEAPIKQHVTHAAHKVSHDVEAVIASVSGEISNIQPVYAATAGAGIRPSMDIFEQALARANSHKETYISPKKAHKQAKRGQRHLSKRLARSGSLALAVLLIGGFIAYQNSANLTMRVASSKAGFHANMPGFKPSGFAVGKFQYGAGFVAVNFHSNSDNRAFNITQKASNWDSAALLNEYVASAPGNSYQTLEANGRTIYTYGNNNATWVDHGVWYNVESNGSLSTTQLVNLATSM